MGGRIREITLTVTTTGAAGSATGSAITNSHDKIPVAGTITASLAQGDALTGAVVVTLRVQTL